MAAAPPTPSARAQPRPAAARAPLGGTAGRERLERERLERERLERERLERERLPPSLRAGGWCFLSGRRQPSRGPPRRPRTWGRSGGGERCPEEESAPGAAGGSSMEDKTCRGNLTAAADEENTDSHSSSINGKPKKLQCFSKNTFSVCCDDSLLSLLVPPSRSGTCHYCGLCGTLRCSQCMQTYYCSADCQKKDWPTHRIVCDPIKQNASNNKTKDGVHLKEEVMLSFAVDLALPDSGDCLNKVPLEMKSHLIPESDANGEDSPEVSENHSKGSEKKIPEDEDSLHCANSVAKCVSLSIGDKFSGVVSHIQNPGSFFCQQLDSARQLAGLEVSLNEYCGKIPSSPSFHPAAGNVCCAQFTEDNLWYRAAVTAYASEDTVLVDYVDYGNSDSVPLTKLRPVIPELMDLPAQAIRCSLAGVKPPLGTWTSEGTSFMKKLVKDKVFAVKVVDKEGSTSVVELVDTSVTPEINVSSVLIEEGCAAEESRVALPAVTMSDAKQENDTFWPRHDYCSEGFVQKEDTISKRTCKWLKLTLKQTVSVRVCTVYSPGEFYCQISNTHELLALNSLNKSMSEYCQKTPPDVFKPENGEPCCAFFSEDGNWYRAVVQNISSGGTVQVSFVDYGNVEEVPLDKIRQISPSFLKLPFQAIRCWLSGIKPRSNRWNQEATKRFHRCTSGLELQATVTSLSKDGAGVVLTDNSTHCPKVINDILTYENLAVKEVLQDKNNFPDKSVDQKVTSLGHWKSFKLAIGETLTVFVTEIVSPDLFYAVPVLNEVQKREYRELTALGPYCKSCKRESFQPKLGEPCCAQFSGNGRWYRALVLEASRSAVKVLYVDYGNTETLPLSKVLPISDSFLKLPFQAIACSLAGIEKTEWSPLVLDKLKEMVLKQYVAITVKGINGDVKLVTVEKYFENGGVNVADKLVKQGLVKSCSAEYSHSEHQGSGGGTKCCCTELKEQLKKHEQILLFLLNKYGNPDGFTEMKNLLQS